MNVFTVQREDGAWLRSVNPLDWTDNPDDALIFTEKRDADTQADSMTEAQESGTNARMFITYIAAASIPTDERMRVPGHDHIDWERDRIPTNGSAYFASMDEPDLIAALAESGFIRIPSPAHPSALMFECFAEPYHRNR